MRLDELYTLDTLLERFMDEFNHDRNDKMDIGSALVVLDEMLNRSKDNRNMRRKASTIEDYE